MWAWGDSNSQVLRHTLLRRTRIPVPPHAHLIYLMLTVLLTKLPQK